MEYLEKVTPILGLVRDGIMKASEFISSAFDLNVENVFLVLLVILSLWSAKKILMFFYATLEGRMGYWAILSGLIFWVLKYLGN
jgi:hypothetical protein